jgi:hypothetical protein
MSFADMKKKRGSSLSHLSEELNKINNPGFGVDERFWKADLDKAGNGYAVIRFLPPIEGEDLPWVRVFNHGFQGPGGWYIENSLTTLGKKDPVSEYNSGLWATGVEANKDIVRKQKRRLTYYANIMVVEDSKRPENEGKVFLFKFGKKIFDKVNDQMNPQFEDETPVNPFDFWEGANFKLKIRKVEGFTNYDKAEFAAPTPLSENDEDMERIWKQQYSLQDFLKPDNFKSYEELSSRLNKVLGKGIDPSMQRAEDTVIGPVDHTSVPFDGGVPNRPAPQPTVSAQNDNLDQGSMDSGEGDTLSYFAKLAEEE